MIGAGEVAAMVDGLGGEPVTWRAGGVGDPVTVAALIDAETVAAEGAEGLAVMVPRTVGRVAVAALAAPRRGDTLTTAGGAVYEVAAPARREPPGDLWCLELVEV